MQRSICQCKAIIYIDETTNHKFNSQATDDPHRCEIPKIPLYDIVNGIAYPRNDLYVAKDITSRAVEFKLDPYRVRVQRQGDYLVLK